MVACGTLVVIRHPDHIATSGVERHQHLSLPAQPIDFKKDLAPGQVGETARQRIQIAPMRALDGSENAISDGCMRSHDQILPLISDVHCNFRCDLLPLTALFPIRDRQCQTPRPA